MSEPVFLPGAAPEPREPSSATRRGARVGALLGLFAAAPLALYLAGFTVDDALIPARYAHHLARGLGYRFNPHGASTDGVTPLGYAHLLAPFARASVLSAWVASRWMGRVVWLVAASALGAAVGALGTARSSGAARGGLRYAALSLVVFSAPLAAWASSGLETPWVVALATCAAVLPARPGNAPAGAACAGACAWLRPEMLPFAAVLSAARARSAPRGGRAFCLALGLGPFLVTAAIRWATWGRPAPLAVWAKPSDLAHGVSYVLPAVLFTGAPFVALAPWAWRKLDSWPKSLLVAGVAHLVVVALAGGDWMPLARLVCPVLPGFVLVAAHLLDAQRAGWALARLACGCAAQVAVLVMRGGAAHRVASDRLALIDAARPLLERATTVATLDVGWVGAATEADVVDLAGATDPEIAALPGGHTSKAISGAFLTARHPDLLLFATDPARPAVTDASLDADRAAAPVRYSRHAERRLAADPLIARHYRAVWASPPGLPLAYVALAREADPSAERRQDFDFVLRGSTTSLAMGLLSPAADAASPPDAARPSWASASRMPRASR